MNKRTSGFESAIGNMCADVDVFTKCDERIENCKK